MAARKQKLAIGVFKDSSAAQAAVRDLIEAGFSEEQIGVVARSGEETTVKTGKGRKKDTGTMVEEGAVTGVAAGAGIGALWALGIAANVLPAIGPVIAGGIFASILASAAGGAAVAGVLGALIGLGIPEEEAHYYEGEFKAGRTLVTVQANGRYDEAVAILRRHGAYTREEALATGTTTTTTPRTVVAETTSRTVGANTEERAGTVELREEEAHVRKRPVKKGEVKVRKEVVTEQKSVTVPVEREEVVIERRPVRRRGSTKSVGTSEEIRIPVTEEEVEIDKDVVVKEEVAVGKRKVRDTETVSTNVKREELKVEQEGQTRVRRRNK